MIEVQGLTKTYGQKQVLADVSFRAENGLVTGFVGPNGAGKSTTMRMIAALEIPDSGTATVDGQPFSKAASPARALGIYLGSDYLPNHMTAAEYLAYVCRSNGLDKTSIPALLQTVELAHAADKPISSYSLGMRQRAELAAALAGNPANLMLDEPVNGLDPMGVQWLRGVVREQARAGRAVLLSSHLLSELELVADYVVMLDQGRVVRMGAMGELAGQSGPVQVLVRTSNDQALMEQLAKGGCQVNNAGGMVRVTNVAPEDIADFVVKSGLRLYHLELKRSSLEELFMAQQGQGVGRHVDRARREHRLGRRRADRVLRAVQGARNAGPVDRRAPAPRRPPSGKSGARHPLIRNTRVPPIRSAVEWPLRGKT